MTRMKLTISFSSLYFVSDAHVHHIIATSPTVGTICPVLSSSCASLFSLSRTFHSATFLIFSAELTARMSGPLNQGQPLRQQPRVIEEHAFRSPILRTLGMRKQSCVRLPPCADLKLNFDTMAVSLHLHSCRLLSLYADWVV